MKLILYIITFVTFSIVNCYKTFAQPSKIDTICYYIDTLKVPALDKMWEIGLEGPFKYYAIQCQCLKYNLKPTFVYNIRDQGTLVTLHDFRKMNFIALSKLIEFSRQGGGNAFNHNHILYFIEPNGYSYIKHKVRSLPPKNPLLDIDAETIKPDTIKTKNEKNKNPY
jgi:hypothetical protein